jgi:hypothetical protein
MRGSAGTVLAVFWLAVLALGLAAAPASGQEDAAHVEGAEEASQKTGPDGTDAEPGGPHEVQVGALINDIQQLDLQTKSYAVDLYPWFKWEDPEIDTSPWPR